MANRVAQIQTLLTIASIGALLTWGVYGLLWQYPNDQASIIQSIFDGENSRTGYLGLHGNGTSIPPGSEYRFKLMYTTTLPPGGGGGGQIEQNGQGFDVGPYGWKTPSSSVTNYDVNYAVFSFVFGDQMGPARPLWFTGPQGNITVSFVTDVPNGFNGFFPKLFGPSVSGTNILEVSAAGNYTLHYLNNGTANDSGWVQIGPSSINYSRPYFVPALVTIGLGAGLAATSVIVRWRKSTRPSTTMGNAVLFVTNRTRASDRLGDSSGPV